ncbi:MAG: T9SS type A sorting domain-containing protein, partial [Dysgonamonadaceae bacterium]|nr:T9SS type A sorting domain-containing protein [Dysgonamonadaceae bacterium]
YANRYTFRSDFNVEGDAAGWEAKTSIGETFTLGQGFAFYAYNELKGLPQGDTGNPFAAAEKISVSGNLAGNSVTEPLNFGGDDQYGESPFALAANPFMTTIDFDALVTDNSNIIANTYMIWTGPGFGAYNPDGNYGVDFGDGGQYIAPLQSFIVQRATGNNAQASGLTFDIAAISANANNAGLRSSATPDNKLEITASNPAASVRTFIAYREGGQPVLSDRDGRKLFSTMNAVPDVYTLKESANGPVAVGANIIATDNLTVPLGIATTYTGVITLTFKGMDRYDAQIELIDKQERPEGIVLTGREVYSYDFTPSHTGVRVEDRFEIRFTPATVTRLQPADDDAKPLVYCRDNTLRVVSPASGIRSVSLCNLQGQEIYTSGPVNANTFTTSRLPLSGAYLVKVTTEAGINHLKVFIK